MVALIEQNNGWLRWLRQGSAAVLTAFVIWLIPVIPSVSASGLNADATGEHLDTISTRMLFAENIFVGHVSKKILWLGIGRLESYGCANRLSECGSNASAVWPKGAIFINRLHSNGFGKRYFPIYASYVAGSAPVILQHDFDFDISARRSFDINPWCGENIRSLHRSRLALATSHSEPADYDETAREKKQEPNR
jgi:hypothetical protein